MKPHLFRIHVFRTRRLIHTPSLSWFQNLNFKFGALRSEKRRGLAFYTRTSCLRYQFPSGKVTRTRDFNSKVSVMRNIFNNVAIVFEGTYLLVYFSFGKPLFGFYLSLLRGPIWNRILKEYQDYFVSRL